MTIVLSSMEDALLNVGRLVGCPAAPVAPYMDMCVRAAGLGRWRPCLEGPRVVRARAALGSGG